MRCFLWKPRGKPAAVAATSAAGQCIKFSELFVLRAWVKTASFLLNGVIGGNTFDAFNRLPKGWIFATNQNSAKPSPTFELSGALAAVFG